MIKLKIDKQEKVVFDYPMSCRLIEQSGYDIPFRKFDKEDDENISGFREDDSITPMRFPSSLTCLQPKYNIGNKTMGKIIQIVAKTKIFENFKEIVEFLMIVKDEYFVSLYEIGYFTTIDRWYLRESIIKKTRLYHNYKIFQETGDL